MRWLLWWWKLISVFWRRLKLVWCQSVGKRSPGLNITNVGKGKFAGRSSEVSCKAAAEVPGEDAASSLHTCIACQEELRYYMVTMKFELFFHLSLHLIMVIKPRVLFMDLETRNYSLRPFNIPLRPFSNLFSPPRALLVKNEDQQDLSAALLHCSYLGWGGWAMKHCVISLQAPRCWHQCVLPAPVIVLWIQWDPGEAHGGKFFLCKQTQQDASDRKSPRLKKQMSQPDMVNGGLELG